MLKGINVIAAGYSALLNLDNIDNNMQINAHLPEKEYKKAEVRWILEQVDDLTDERLTLKVSDVATQRRILPKG